MKLNVLLLTTLALLFPSGLGFATESADLFEEPAQQEVSASSDLGEEILVTLQVPLMSPLFSTTPVAVVNEEPITISDLIEQIASMHAGKHQEATSVRKNYANLLERLITVKLILEEARNIGFDELPTIEGQIEQFSSELLISRIMSPQMKAVEADPAEVDKLYKKMSRELLLTALTFKREEDALGFQVEYRARDDFKELARLFVEAGRADGAVDDQQYMKLKELRPQIAQAAFEMKSNSASQIFSASDGFLIFYLHDARFYEDAEVKAEARRLTREPLMKERANEYIETLIQKYCTIDQNLLKEIDLERQKTGFFLFRKEKPVDFQKLLDDGRILATVHGDAPSTVTVGDLAAKLEERHFHGIEKVARDRKLNAEKWRVLRDILFKKAAKLEAMRLGEDQTEEYLEAVDSFSDALLFDIFIKKVVAPDVKISEEEVREYFREHIGDFSSPTMYRMNGLAFAARSDAERAQDKLRRGADFKWVSANSPGQVDKETEGASIFDNALLSLTALPEDLHHAVEAAQQGDSILYSDPEGHHYVINIKHVFPAKPQPYETAREPISKIIFGQKVKELIDYWSEQLREAYETKIFITGVDD